MYSIHFLSSAQNFPPYFSTPCQQQTYMLFNSWFHTLLYKYCLESSLSSLSDYTYPKSFVAMVESQPQTTFLIASALHVSIKSVKQKQSTFPITVIPFFFFFLHTLATFTTFTTNIMYSNWLTYATYVLFIQTQVPHHHHRHHDHHRHYHQHMYIVMQLKSVSKS